MKRIILFLTALLLLFVACERKCLNIKERPKKLKPIDRENYNDVQTVYWNLYSLIPEGKMLPTHTEIMVYGWIYNQNQDDVSARSFILVDDPNIIFDSSIHGIPKIDIENGFGELQAMFDTCYFIKKCFVKGKLHYNHIDYGCCKIIEPKMYITDINDIYFN